MQKDTSKIYEEAAQKARAAVEGLEGIPDRPLTDDEMAKLADLVMGFAQEMTGMTLYPYELEFGWRVIYSLLIEDAEEITALFARQSGKSETVAVLVCGAMVLLPVLGAALGKADDRLAKFKNGLWCGIYAPNYEQAGILWSRMKLRMYSKEAKEALLDPDIDIDLAVERENMTLPNGSFCDCGTASPQASIEGKTYHLILLEECQDIKSSKIRASIHPMGAACVTGEALVPTREGSLVPLGQMHGLAETLHFDGGLKARVAMPRRHLDSGIQPCITMGLHSGKAITGTYSHPVLVKPREYPRKPVWRKLEDLKIGVQCAVPREVPFFGVESIGVVEARLLGMLVGDGSYARGCSPAFSSEDAELITFIGSWVREQNGIIRVDRSHLTKKGRKYQELRIVSSTGGKGKNPLINLLAQVGIYGQTKGKKRVPGVIWKTPKEEVAAFLGGIFDTDGCVQIEEDRRVRIDVSQSHREILVEVMHLCQKFGVHGVIRSCPASGTGYAEKGREHYRFTISDKDSVIRFCDSVTLLVPRKQVKLDRARAILAAHKSKRRASVIVGSGDARRAEVLDNDLVWERVISLEKVGEKQVYDLVMPSSGHNFVANGIVVHNTAASLVKIGTCNRIRSDFYDACRRNKRADVNHGLARSKKRNHYQFDYTTCQRYNPRYRKYIEKEKVRLGEDSDDFKMKYRLQWLLERGMFVNPDMFDECGIHEKDSELRVKKGRGRHIKEIVFHRSSNVVTYDPTTPNLVAAIDVGRENSTVITVGKPFWDGPVEYADEERYPIHILNWLELYGDDHEAQHPQIIDFLKNYRISQAIVDATGKGDPVYSRLASELATYGIEVIPFIFSAQSKDVGYKILLQELQNKRFTYPAGSHCARLQKWQKFKAQMYDLEKDWRGSMMSVHKPKDSDEARDDFPDSAMMLCWLVNVEANEEVESTANPLVGRAAKWIAAEVMQNAKSWYRGVVSTRRPIRNGHRSKWDQ